MARLQVGCEFFRGIREDDLCYVDKTGFIEEFLTPSCSRISLITRPRRFGKTLMLTMLRDFFDISQDSKAIFDGLAISKNKALCDSWMNQYPVVLVTMKDVSGVNFKHAMESYSALMGQTCGNLAYLQESPKVRSREKKLLASLENNTNKRAVLEGSLVTLCRALHAHWGRPAILLIDEYELPLARAQENGYYSEMEEFMRTMLKETFQHNEFLQSAILAGCLRIAKESIFTGLDSFRGYDVTQARFADKIGFTSEEVDELLTSAALSEKKDAIKEWYGGYRFGDDTEMYCPWNILQYIEDLQANPAASPKLYWGNTSGNDVVCSAVAHSNEKHVRDSLDSLMAGGCVAARLTKNLTHDCLYDSPESIWTVLLSAGYLSKASPAQMKKCDLSPGAGQTVLAIPNKEVLEIFADAISEWFDETVQDIDRTALFKAFWANDADGLAELLCDQMEDTLSYYDAREDFYHAFILGLFTFTGWEVESNKEYGKGRPDVVLRDTKNRRAAIIEIKRAKSERGLPGMAGKALLQVKKSRYAAPLLKRNWKVSFWGMAFFKKSCILRVEEGAAHPKEH